MGGIVSSVAKGSMAETMGVLPGDEIVCINGRPVRDIIDYQFETAGASFRLAVLRDCELVCVPRGRLPLPACDGNLGIEFKTPLFDGVVTCRNRCPFCFIDQLPKGLRQSLYLKDDDYRLSFLGGNFITLANLTPRDWARIAKMRLSPLYVSVHATDEKIRSLLLGKSDLPPIMKQLARLKEKGIQAHCQVVLCPGINDGGVLEKSVSDLASLFPAAKSLGVVPVGITRFCKSRVIRRVDSVVAGETLGKIGTWQLRFKRELGYPFVFAADEFYLLAGRAFPPYAAYADFPQLENGIGMVACFLKDLQRLERRKVRAVPRFTSATLVTGHAAYGLLRRAAGVIFRRGGVDLRIVSVENQFFGPTVTVAGLLSGGDILSALRRRELGDAVIVPAAALNPEGLFLDGLRLGDLAEELGRPVFTARCATEVERILSPCAAQKARVRGN